MDEMLYLLTRTTTTTTKQSLPRHSTAAILSGRSASLPLERPLCEPIAFFTRFFHSLYRRWAHISLSLSLGYI